MAISSIQVWDDTARTWNDLRAPTKYIDLNAVTINLATLLWTPAAGKKFRLMGGSISVSAAGSVLFTDASGGTTVWRTPLLALNNPYNFDLGGLGYLSALASNGLYAVLSVNGTITGTLYGQESL